MIIALKGNMNQRKIINFKSKMITIIKNLVPQNNKFDLQRIKSDDSNANSQGNNKDDLKNQINLVLI